MYVFISAICCFALTTASAGAQEDSTLESLIANAIKNNENLSATKARVESIKAFNEQTVTLANPVLSVLNNSQGISQTLPNFAVLDAKRQVADYSLQEANLTYQNEENAIVKSIMTSYYNYILARHKIETIKELQTSLQSFAIQTNSKFEVGQATILDKLKIDYELALATRDLEASQQELTLAKTSLANLTRLNEADISISEDFGEPQLTKTHILDISDNAEVALASATVKKLDAAVNIYNLFPELTVVANNDMAQNTQSVGVSLPLPLWDRTQNTATGAKLMLKEGELRYQATRYRILLDMQTQYQQYTLAVNQLALYEKYKIKQRANDARYTAQTQYQANQITTLDYLDSLRSYKASNLDYWQNKYNQNVSYANIELILRHRFWETNNAAEVK